MIQKRGAARSEGKGRLLERLELKKLGGQENLGFLWLKEPNQAFFIIRELNNFIIKGGDSLRRQEQ